MRIPFGWLADFVKRQRRNFRVLLARKLGYSLLGRLSRQYTSLYAIALGADKIALGSLNSVGSAVSTVLSLPIGRLVDRYSLKKMMLFAMILEILVPVAYAVARDWIMLIPALRLSNLLLLCCSCFSNNVCTFLIVGLFLLLSIS